MTPPKPLTELAERVERLTGPCRETDEDIARAVGYVPWGGTSGYGLTYEDSDGRYIGAPPKFTESIDAIRSLGGMVVLASDIGADGLAMVKIVTDTSTSPIIELTGIALRLEHAWLASALRARAALENSHG